MMLSRRNLATTGCLRLAQVAWYRAFVLSSTRQDAILRRLRSDGEVSGRTLAAEFGVSTSTIRRDLDVLSQDRLLRRVRGGGSSVEPDLTPFREVSHLSGVEKDAIAVRAAQLVPDGSVVLIDIGTTTARLAHHLRGRKLTVITSSLAVVVPMSIRTTDPSGTSWAARTAIASFSTPDKCETSRNGVRSGSTLLPPPRTLRKSLSSLSTSRSLRMVDVLSED